MHLIGEELNSDKCGEIDSVGYDPDTTDIYARHIDEFVL